MIEHHVYKANCCAKDSGSAMERHPDSGEAYDLATMSIIVKSLTEGGM
jgi:hypothetical protein